MKNIFYLSLILITSIYLSSCVFGKKDIHQNPVNVPSNTETTDNIKINNNDHLVIYCGRDSIFYDNKFGLIRSSNTDAYYCLRKKAFQGDTTACRQIANLIPMMRNPFGVFNKQLRGEILFKAVLERLNNFEFVPAPGGEMNVFTYYNSYASIMTDMIESIDGMHRYDYLKILVKEKWTPELNELVIDSPEQIQAMSKIYWEIYKEAYDKGLIKLKDFGQE